MAWLTFEDCLLWPPGPRLSATEQLLLIRIGARCGRPSDTNEGLCWESQASMAEAIGKCERTVIRALNRLDALEYIIKHETLAEDGVSVLKLKTRIHPRVRQEFEQQKAKRDQAAKERTAKAKERRAAKYPKPARAPEQLDPSDVADERLTASQAQIIADKHNIAVSEVRDAHMVGRTIRIDGTLPEGSEQVVQDALMIGFVTQAMVERARAHTEAA